MDDALGLKAKKIIFKFRGFEKSFDDHLLRGEIKIKIVHNQDPKNIKEAYKYATGKGGVNAKEIKPPWQVKKDVSGLHMHQKLDGKLLRKSEIKEVYTLKTGEKVEVV